MFFKIQWKNNAPTKWNSNWLKVWKRFHKGLRVRTWNLWFRVGKQKTGWWARKHEIRWFLGQNYGFWIGIQATLVSASEHRKLWFLDLFSALSLDQETGNTRVWVRTQRGVRSYKKGKTVRFSLTIIQGYTEVFVLQDEGLYVQLAGAVEILLRRGAELRPPELGFVRGFRSRSAGVHSLGLWRGIRQTCVQRKCICTLRETRHFFQVQESCCLELSHKPESDSSWNAVSNNSIRRSDLLTIGIWWTILLWFLCVFGQKGRWGQLEPQTGSSIWTQGLIHTGRRTQCAMQCNASKWDLLLSIGVFTLHASNIKGKMFQFECTLRHASCVNEAQGVFLNHDG